MQGATPAQVALFPLPVTACVHTLSLRVSSVRIDHGPAAPLNSRTTRQQQQQQPGLVC